MKLLYSVPFNNQSLTFYLPKGSYGYFLISYTGTNNATPKTRLDLGNVQLVHNSNPIINVDAEMLSYLADLKGGYTTFVSTTSSTLNATVIVPCGKFNDRNNSYVINDNNKFYFKLDFPNLSNITGTISIYGVPKLGVQNYMYGIMQRNVVASGASTVSDVHRVSNALATYIKTSGSITQVQLVRDNQVVADSTLQDLGEFSDFVNQVESSSSLIEVDFNLSNDIREAVSNEIQFKYVTSAAVTVQQYFSFAVLTPAVAHASVIDIDAQIAAKVASGLIKDLPPKPIKISGVKASQSIGSNVAD